MLDIPRTRSAEPSHFNVRHPCSSHHSVRSFSLPLAKRPGNYKSNENMARHTVNNGRRPPWPQFFMLFLDLVSIMVQEVYKSNPKISGSLLTCGTFVSLPILERALALLNTFNWSATPPTAQYGALSQAQCQVLWRKASTSRLLWTLAFLTDCWQ